MKKKLFYIIIFTTIISFFTYQIFSLIESRKFEQLQAEKNLINVTYNTVIEAFRVHSEILYKNTIDTKNIKSLLSPIYDVSLEKQNEIRSKLYSELLEVYNNIESFQLKQLHFHLKDNQSFLRFHRPNKYGDDLTNIRETVTFVNKYKKAVHGFEEGRIFNGYRFVYPLNYNDKYIGSVETSVSMKIIINELKRVFNGDVDFIINKDIVNKKVFKNELKNYNACRTIVNFYHEKAISKNGNPLIEQLIKNYKKRDDIISEIKKNTTFNFFENAGDNNYITTFFPIKSAISQNIVGYIIVANKHNEFFIYKDQYMLFLYSLIFLFSLIIFFIYKIDLAKKNLFHQNKILHEVQQIGHIGYWELDLSENKLTLSSQLYHLLGVTKNKSISTFDQFLNYIHPNDIQKVHDTYFQSIETKSDYYIEYRILSKMGKIKYVSEEAHHTLNTSGNIVQSLGIIHEITATKLYQKEIETTKAHFESLVSHIPDVIYKCKNDNDFTMVYLNESIYSITGYNETELISNKELSFSSIIHPEDILFVQEKIKNALLSKKQDHVLEYRIVKKNQDIIWVKDSFEFIKDGAYVYIEGAISDITSQKESYEKLQKFIDTQKNILILTNGKTINYANKSFFNFFGYKDIKNFKEYHQCICEYFYQDDRFFHLGKITKDQNWLTIMNELPTKEQIVMIQGRDLIQYIFAVTINIFEEDISIVSFADISGSMHEKFILEEKSIRDPLTNAYNREYFESNYQRKIIQAKNNKKQLGLAILDIDHFKKVNDTFGHDVGDYVLIELVNKINNFSRTEDTLIRWGGEEFLLMISIDSYQALFKVLENIRSLINNHYFQTVEKITVSIGGSIYVPNEAIKKAIKRADIALYSSKSNGRNMVNLE